MTSVLQADSVGARQTSRGVVAKKDLPANPIQTLRNHCGEHARPSAELRAPRWRGGAGRTVGDRNPRLWG
eukprot:3926779-Prymnesium_polylepis.1